MVSPENDAILLLSSLSISDIIRPGPNSRLDGVSGNLCYMAPELFLPNETEHNTERSDVWSFGMTVYVSVVPFTTQAVPSLFLFRSIF